MSQQSNMFYMGNKNLPNVNWKGEYTTDQVKALKKASQNILYFAENYFYIINLDRGRETIDLYTAQKRALRKMRDNRFFIQLASRQIGKALALDTPIPTPNGWTDMGSLKDGDTVYDINGEPCNVIKAHAILHNRQCYKVTFDSGEEIVADGDHLWRTQTYEDRRRKVNNRVRTTKEILNTLLHGGKPHHRIPICSNGVCGSKKDLITSPYILGLRLGGEVDDKFIDQQYNLPAELNIPDDLLSCERSQRLDLLRGLMDSDNGSIISSRATFNNTHKPLIEQVEELVISLGYKTTSDDTSVTFIPTENICYNPTKRSNINYDGESDDDSQWHYITNIERVDSVPVRCITVDSKDNLFLAGKQNIATHNSTMMTIYILWQACFNSDQRILLVANKEATAIEIFQRVRMAYEELPNWLKPPVKEYAKTSMTLENGSRIGITTTTGSAARGQSVNCVDGLTTITLKDKETGKVFDCTMEDLEAELEDGELLPIFLEES